MVLGSRYDDEGVGDSIVPRATGVEGNCAEGSWLEGSCC
jgi:hypothetical protein